MKPLQACLLTAICLFVLLFIMSLKLPIRTAVNSKSDWSCNADRDTNRQKSVKPKGGYRVLLPVCMCLCLFILKSNYREGRREKRKYT